MREGSARFAEASCVFRVWAWWQGAGFPCAGSALSRVPGSCAWAAAAPPCGLLQRAARAGGHRTGQSRDSTLWGPGSQSLDSSPHPPGARGELALSFLLLLVYPEKQRLPEALHGFLRRGRWGSWLARPQASVPRLAGAASVCSQVSWVSLGSWKLQRRCLGSVPVVVCLCLL